MELSGKKINFLGDSITEGVGASSPENCFVSVFGRMTGSTVRNYGIGGTRIARVHHKLSGNPRWDLNFLDRVGEMDADADIVVIFGGTNDFGHGDGNLGAPEETEDEYTFRGALHSLIRRVMDRYPEARIVLLTPLHRKSELVTVNEFGLPTSPLSAYVRILCETAALYSLPVLDLWSVSGIQPRDPKNSALYTTDGLHPNDRGAERIAVLLKQFLENTL